MSLERGGGRGGGQGQRFKAVNGFWVTDITQCASHSATGQGRRNGTVSGSMECVGEPTISLTRAQRPLQKEEGQMKW